MRLAREAAAQLNRLIHAHRTAAGDPFIADVDPGRAVAVRFGFGTGDEVADGRWRRANELPDIERRKLIERDYEALRPQERIAAVLGGRESVGAHEDLIVRARGDLDAGRVAAAALGLNAGARGLSPPAVPRSAPPLRGSEPRRPRRPRRSRARSRPSSRRPSRRRGAIRRRAAD